MSLPIGFHEEFGVFFGEVFVGLSKEFNFVAQNLLAVIGGGDGFFSDILGHTSCDYTTP